MDEHVSNGSVSWLRHRTEKAARQRQVSPTVEEMARRITHLLDVSGLDYDGRIEAIGRAFVAEALSRYWLTGDATENHAHLAADDPVLAEAVEGMGPFLLGRLESREAVEAVEQLLAE